MSRIHEASETALLPQFGLWTLPPTQNSVIRDVEYELRPKATFSSSTPLKFEHTCPADEYLMLNESHLNIRLRITLKSLATTPKTINAASWSKVTPVNNFMHSLFDQVTISVNNTPVTRSPMNYAYRAFFETYLAYADSAKNGHGQSVMYGDNEDNRRALMLEGLDRNELSCVVDLEGPIHSDLTFQEKAIIGGTNIVFEFIPAKPSFYLNISDDSYAATVEFEQAILYVDLMKVSPELEHAHRMAIERAPVRYPITRTQVYHREIQKGVHQALLDNVTSGQLPRRIFFGLVDHDAFGNGNVKKDPYTFKNFGLTFVACYVGGTQYPAAPYQPDFDTPCHTREFRSLYRALNQTGTDTYLSVTKKEWKETKCIFGFNFAPDCSNGGSVIDHVNLKERGDLRIHLKFKSALPESINLVVFAEFDNCIEIDSLGNVIVDYI